MTASLAAPLWQDIAARKREDLLKSIPAEWLIPATLLPAPKQLDVTTFPKASGWFTPAELEITAATSSEIVAKVQSRVWTALSVTMAFCKRAAAAHQLTNCLTETMFPEAIATAKSLDDHLARTGKTLGPLHGLPISIKDNFNVIGKDSTVGFVAWCNKPATSNSVLVDLLISLGAVLYVKTTTPTAMMIAETVSNVSGRTTNPLRTTLSAGGSSGGESALIAFQGSPLGVGTDIGGSVRIPASACGLFTLRPSLGRFPTGGCTSGLAGQEAVNSVNGPLGRTLSDLTLFAKSIVDSESWLKDAKVLPIPWRTVSLGRKLKIAVLWDDGMVKPTPPVRRALKHTAEKLVAAGHSVVDWSSEGHSTALQILGRMFVADGGKSCAKVLGAVNEPWRPEMLAYADATELGCHDLWQLQLERNELCKRYIERWAACAGLDAILSPTTPYSTVEHGKYRHVGYTGIWNVLDYSAVNFPSGVRVDRSLDMEDNDRTSLGSLDDEVRKDYNVDAVHGMPVGLQLICRRLEEEKVLAIAEVVLEALEN